MFVIEIYSKSAITANTFAHLSVIKASHFPCLATIYDSAFKLSKAHQDIDLVDLDVNLFAHYLKNFHLLTPTSDWQNIVTWILIGGIFFSRESLLETPCNTGGFYCRVFPVCIDIYWVHMRGMIITPLGMFGLQGILGRPNHLSCGALGGPS